MSVYLELLINIVFIIKVSSHNGANNQGESGTS